MKSLFFAALFAFAAPAFAAAPPVDQSSWPRMTAGLYEIRLDGMVCRNCAALIEQEAAKLGEVESVTVDFDDNSVVVGVRKGKILKVSALRRALDRAARRVDLGAHYAVVSIRYSVRR